MKYIFYDDYKLFYELIGLNDQNQNNIRKFSNLYG